MNTFELAIMILWFFSEFFSEAADHSKPAINQTNNLTSLVCQMFHEKISSCIPPNYFLKQKEKSVYSSRFWLFVEAATEGVL